MRREELNIKVSSLNAKEHSEQEDSHVRLTQNSDFKSAFYISMIVFSVFAAVACVLITQVVRF